MPRIASSRRLGTPLKSRTRPGYLPTWDDARCAEGLEGRPEELAAARTSAREFKRTRHTLDPIRYATYDRGLYSAEIGVSGTALHYLFLPPRGLTDFPTGNENFKNLVARAFLRTIGPDLVRHSKANFNGMTATSMILADSGSRRLSGTVSIMVKVPQAVGRPYAARVLIHDLLGALDSYVHDDFDKLKGAS